MFNETMQFDFNEVPEIHFSMKELDAHSREVHETAVLRAKKYLVAEAELLDAIIQVDLDKTYLKFGETHLTPYCEKYLNLTSDVAANFVRVARKSLQVPELRDAVDQGLSVTKARAIASVVTTENHQTWIEKAQQLSKEKLEKEIAKANPSAKKPDRAKPTGENRTRLEFEIGDAEMIMQKRATDLISRKLGKSASLAEVQAVLLSNFLKQHDPVKKAERASHRKNAKVQKTAIRNAKTQISDQSRDRSLNRSDEESKPVQSTAQMGRAGIRKAIPAEVKHAVYQRDHGQCQAKLRDGATCLQSRWAEIHHIKLKSLGGADTPENLITLCSSHHRILHRHL